jgi:hypothetical protein
MQLTVHYMSPLFATEHPVDRSDFEKKRRKFQVPIAIILEIQGFDKYIAVSATILISCSTNPHVWFQLSILCYHYLLTCQKWTING